MTSILVIDDEETIRKSFCRLLRSHGYDVREAENGEQGLKAYQSSPADVVLLDVFMPVKDGIETLNALLLHDPKVRVIAMTGGGIYKNSDILETTMCLGACKILHKPITVQDMKSAIEEALAMAC